MSGADLGRIHNQRQRRLGGPGQHLARHRPEPDRRPHRAIVQKPAQPTGQTAGLRGDRPPVDNRAQLHAPTQVQPHNQPDQVHPPGAAFVPQPLSQQLVPKTIQLEGGHRRSQEKAWWANLTLLPVAASGHLHFWPQVSGSWFRKERHFLRVFKQNLALAQIHDTLTSRASQRRLKSTCRIGAGSSQAYRQHGRNKMLFCSPTGACVQGARKSKERVTDSASHSCFTNPRAGESISVCNDPSACLICAFHITQPT
jgi:hypothetical protein